MKILYFAWLRTRIGFGEEEVDLPPNVRTVADLMHWLQARGPGYAAAFASTTMIRAAVDQDYVGMDHGVIGANEVAFFPPVTGGMAGAVVRVQREDFDPGAELERLSSGRTDLGGTVSFVGLVRGAADDVRAMTLEHYPGMTERALAAIAEDARGRWPGIELALIHRFGRLKPGDRIVFVGVAAAHRAEAFAACEFLVDWLKTKAPFWKLEEGPDGPQWVEAQHDDEERALRW